MTTRSVPNNIMIPQVAELVAEGCEVEIIARGTSMLPFIRDRKDSVVLGPFTSIRPMDIALVRMPGDKYVMHRVIELQGDMVTLMGDGNIRGIEICRRRDVLAIACAILRNGKRIDCHGRSHMLKARIWLMLRPVRRILLAIYRRLPGTIYKEKE